MAILIKCKACGKDVSENAAACPSCGEPTSNTVTTLTKSLVAILILASLLFLLVYNSGEARQNTASVSGPKPPLGAYANAQPLNYREAMLEQLERGHLVRFEGTVIEVISRRSVRLALGKGLFAFLDSDVLLQFSQSIPVLGDDQLTGNGRYGGVVTYETVLGASRTIPVIVVDYHTNLSER